MTPVSPILFSSLGSLLHHSSVNYVPYCSDDITRELNFCGKWNSSQEVCCGNFKLKYESNEGETFCISKLVECLEAMSTMLLRAPATQRVNAG